jgi:hypothetical protein
MKRIAFTILIIVIVLGGGWLVFQDPGHIRQFDANLQPLAENYQEAYCNGEEFMSNNGARDVPQVIECVKNLTIRTPNIMQAIPGFCQAIVYKGFPGSKQDCENIFEEKELWPLLYGGITDEWNSGHPRPAPPEGEITKDRGGLRPEYERGIGGIVGG